MALCGFGIKESSLFMAAVLSQVQYAPLLENIERYHNFMQDSYSVLNLGTR